jgi:hypothetical protein
MHVAVRFCALYLVFQAAFATTVPRRSLEELVAGSGQILQGRVLSHSVEWDSSHRFLWTHYSVEIADVLKGPRGSAITISEPGGTRDGLTMSVAGVAQFADGEEVVVFLHRTPIAFWRTYGYSQGKFSVRTASPGGPPEVFNNAAGVSLVDPPSSRSASSTPLARWDGAGLREFKAMVRGLVRRQERQ